MLVARAVGSCRADGRALDLAGCHDQLRRLHAATGRMRAVGVGPGRSRPRVGLGELAAGRRRLASAGPRRARRPADGPRGAAAAVRPRPRRSRLVGGGASMTASSTPPITAGHRWGRGDGRHVRRGPRPGRPLRRGRRPDARVGRDRRPRPGRPRPRGVGATRAPHLRRGGGARARGHGRQPRHPHVVAGLRDRRAAGPGDRRRLRGLRPAGGGVLRGPGLHRRASARLRDRRGHAVRPRARRRGHPRDAARVAAPSEPTRATGCATRRATRPISPRSGPTSTPRRCSASSTAAAGCSTVSWPGCRPALLLWSASPPSIRRWATRPPTWPDSTDPRARPTSGAAPTSGSGSAASRLPTWPG